MQFNYIISKQVNAILFITLNRPDKHNALCIDLVKELNLAFTEAKDNDGINAIFVLGNKNAFSAGGDLKEMKTLEKAEAQKRSAFVQETFCLMSEIEIPVISLISGICFGGGLELALHTDFRICAESARIGLPEVKYGMIPGAGGTVQLPNYLGKADASYYLLTGNEIPLQKALHAGLIQKTVADKEFNNEIEILANYFRSANRNALKAVKKMLMQNGNNKTNANYAMESDFFATLLTQQGHRGIEDKFIKNK